MTDALIGEDLTVRRGARTVVEGVTLRARHGEVTALIGPNGAGKSTLLRALVGILPSTGTIRAEGRDLRSISGRERARLVAYVPQQSQLTAGLRVHDVVTQGRFAHGATSGRALQGAVRAALADVQVDHLASLPFNRLSGGEQRRVLLARALATGARVLLLDEPTAGLDVAHVLRFHQLMRTLATRRFAVVSVLHDLVDVMHHADRAVLLARGRIVRVGTAAEVVASSEAERTYGIRMRTQATLPFELVEGTT